MIAVWFGCDGVPGHGYHPSVLDGRWTRHLSPWGDQIDSGDMYPGPQGVARLHHKDGWTALQFGDRTGDRRGGSNTAFVFDQILTSEEALAAARERWPHLFERFTFEIVPETPAAALGEQQERRNALEMDGTRAGCTPDRERAARCQPDVDSKTAKSGDAT